MKKGLNRPKQQASFFDNYKALRAAMAFLLLSVGASAQYDSTKLKQDVSTYGFRWKNGEFRYSFILPKDTPHLAVIDSGAMAYKGGSVFKWTGYAWSIASGSSGWSLPGNSGTTPGTNFLGTADNKGLMFKTNNIQSGYIDLVHTNTSFGKSSLISNTTGLRNVAIGSESLTTSASGFGNVAVGDQTLKNSIGDYNTAIGLYALLSTLGQHNTAVGSQALGSTTGSNSTAVGSSSLTQATGSSNTAVGFASGFKVTSGTNNTLLGDSTAWELLTGNYNTVVGDATGSGIQSGSYNTIVGARVSGLSSSLSNNVILADGTGAIRAQSGSSGAWKLPYYGSGSFTGTPAYSASFDASGNLIESAVSTTSTLQQVFNTETGGSVLTKNDTIAGGGFNWRMINMGITSIAQNAKTAVTGANGTANVSPLTVTGGAGGATSYSPAGTVTGGNAGAVNITSGNGGAITGTPTTGIGGTGGDINILAGDGGLGTTLGGTAGSAILQAGTGGGGTSGGAAGYVSLKGGLAGSTGNASGGNIFLIPGTGNGTGKSGTTFLGVSPSYTIRGNTVIGNSSDNYTNLLQVNGSVNINKDSLAITTGKKWKVMIDTATGTLVRDSTTADLSAYLPLAGGTMTGALINSKNGAVSTPTISGTGTWYSGGSATTTKPYLLIQPTGTTSTGWNTSGTGLGVNAASGFTGYFQDWQLNGVSKANLDYIGNLTAAGLRSGGEIRGGATAYIYWNARSLMSSPSDGNILFQNQAGTDFTRIQLGGTTSSFPSIARNGTGIDIKLADNSAYTGIQSLYDRFGSGSPESVVTAPVGAIYHRTDGGAGTSFYVKESGSGNTGWVAK